MTDTQMRAAAEAMQDDGSLNGDDDLNLTEIAAKILARWQLVLLCSLAAGVLTLGGTYLIKPSFTARTSFLPPQQQPSAAASALGALGALAGAMGGMRTTGDQYLTLLQSRTLADRMVDRFDLLKTYDEELRIDARRELAKNSRIELGRKDGFLSIEVDDHDPQRAAAMANAYVEELQRLASNLALTEAQQRRMFFEAQLVQVRKRLDEAQANLRASGVDSGTLKAEPKATAESYARLRAELTSAEVRLQALRRSLSEDTPEIQRQLAVASTLRSSLQRQEQVEGGAQGSGYISAYREYKYQEALFDLMARQFESARVDEGREGGQLQVVDVASPPERKSKPRRAVLSLIGLAIGFAVSCAFVLSRGSRSRRTSN